MNKPIDTSNTLLVGFDFHRGVDAGFIIVAQKLANEHINIINTISGKEAFDIYEKLISVKKGVDNDGTVKTS